MYNKKCADFFTPLIGNQNILQRLFLGSRCV